MQPSQVEAWALAVADRVTRQQQVEDSRVEVKREWPEPERAARRLAGHANASRGEPILWLIGLDEKAGVVGALQNEPANWYKSVAAYFDGIAPTLQDYVVPIGDASIVALYFATDRSPYVIANAVFGKPGAGSVEREVPWREGTAVRSARREDLLRILVPQIRLPDCEFLSAQAFMSLEHGEPGNNFSATLRFYIAPRTSDRLVMPRHKTVCTISRPDGRNSAALTVDKLGPVYQQRLVGYAEEPVKPEVLSHTILSSPSEVIVDGPGVVEVIARGRVSITDFLVEDELVGEVSMLPVFSEVAVRCPFRVRQTRSGNSEVAYSSRSLGRAPDV